LVTSPKGLARIGQSGCKYRTYFYAGKQNVFSGKKNFIII